MIAEARKESGSRTLNDNDEAEADGVAKTSPPRDMSSTGKYLIAGAVCVRKSGD